MNRTDNDTATDRHHTDPRERPIDFARLGKLREEIASGLYPSEEQEDCAIDRLIDDLEKPEAVAVDIVGKESFADKVEEAQRAAWDAANDCDRFE